MTTEPHGVANTVNTIRTTSVHGMSSHFADAIYPQRTANTGARTYWHVIEVTPVTLTVVLGPLIAIVYRLTQPADGEIGGFSLAQAIRGLLCVLMFLSLFLSAGLRSLTHRLAHPPSFLAIYAILTSFTSPYPYENIVFAVRMAFVILVFASAFQLAAKGLCGERWLTTCAWVILLVVAMCIGVGLATGITIDVYGGRYATAGCIGQPYVASCLILSALPVFIGIIPHSGSAVAGIVLLFASLFFMMCRSALIAATVATCSSFLINLRSVGRRILRRRILPSVAILLLLAGLGLGTAAGADLIERFRDLNPLEGTGSGRYIFWRIALEHILNRPMHVQLLGEGMGSIRDVIGQRFAYSIGAHNDWLDLTNAFGLCGLIGISWWYAELARFAWGLRGRQDGLFQGACASVIVLALISAGTGGFFEPSWALTYAALGFWAGSTAHEEQHRHTGSD